MIGKLVIDNKNNWHYTPCEYRRVFSEHHDHVLYFSKTGEGQIYCFVDSLIENKVMNTFARLKEATGIDTDDGFITEQDFMLIALLQDNNKG